MNEQLENALRRELREVADQLPIPPRPALRQAPARAVRRWRPLLVAATVGLIVGMVAALAVVFGTGRSMQPALPPTPTIGTPIPTGETAPHDGFTLYVSAAPPHVLIATRSDLPVYDPSGETWSGRLLYNDDCECFVLLEDGADGAVTIVAWLPATEGYTEGKKRGVAQYHGARILEGTHVTGTGVRVPDCEDTPLRLPASVRRLGPECLVVLGVDF
ncbi:hypothetical protein [Microlunatus parietis]|uniref:Uncharacterized protein n=1 Tax=Microlunatus parietis TaxID=682979 RepID=A0A7Y9I9J5_9ACTN|nr:hypothetical protein [Microlunatus parietis]NYE72828.1 hypothetical protein [Microlunatus parietis]